MTDKYKTLIIACWGALILCLMVKLVYPDAYVIYVSNEKFIAICDWLDNTLWAKYLVSSIVYSLSQYLIYLAMIKKKILKDWWYILICLPCSIIKVYNAYIGFAYDLLLLLVIPMVRTKFKRWWQILLGIALVMIFQLVSMYMRNISFNLNNETFLVGLVMQIDYYIMIALYYLYSNAYTKRKEQ